ncbi:response regulator [Butyricimonas faecihominis]|jgi:response regulator receiver domain|uniref:response regulator n=1 Tax=Butyricimonas faecihominis TaxID=1472416 RepID=UPI0032C1D3EC
MKIKILFAENDEFEQEFGVRRLKECGFNVSLVEDGQKAWDEYQKGCYDVLLLDGDIPKMRGEEVMRLVRETGDDIAIVMYCNMPDHILLNEGVDDCIDKGTRNLQEVECRIKKAFKRSQERKERNRLKAPKTERKTF